MGKPLGRSEVRPDTLSDDAIVNETMAGPGVLEKSASWMQKARVRGDGPPYFKIGKNVRYRVGDLRTWAASKRVHSTSERG